MLKIFLSSTYRDLFKYREKILEEVENVLRGIGMEKFVPDGSNSQEKCITELKESQIIVFLISPYSTPADSRTLESTYIGALIRTANAIASLGRVSISCCLQSV